MKPKAEKDESLKVLCLEDSPRDVEIMRESLTDAGYNVDMDCTDNEKEYISFLRNRKYDIILSDFKLPGFDGFTALRRAVETCPDVPFICVSGTIGEEAAVDLLKMGAVDYVMKDRLKRLPVAIKRALDEAKEKELRQLAQKELRKSEQQIRTFLDSTTDLAFLKDESFRHIIVNSALCKFFGKTESEIIGKTDFDLMTEKAAMNCRNTDEQIVRSNALLKSEEIIGERYYETLKFPVEISKGKNGIGGYIRDITDRKQAEDALRENENRWRSLVKTIPDYIALLDKDINYLFLNHYAEGFSEENVIGRSAVEFIPTESQAHYKEGFESALSTEKTVFLEYDGFGNEGTIRKYDSFFVPVIENDQFLYMLVLARDITGRKQAEEALRNSEERYRMLFTFSPDPLYVHVENRIKLVNPAICQLLGADDPSQLIGKSIFEIIHPEYHDIVRERVKLVLSNQPVMLIDEKFIRLDGTIVDVEVNAVSIEWQGSRGVQVIARDITERKKAESELLFRNVILSTQQEASIDGILVVDENSTIISYNQQFLKIWGVSPELLEKNTDESILTVVMDKMGDTSSFLKQVQYLNEHNRETSRDDIVFKDGRIFDRYSAPMFGEDSKYFGRVWYFRDITDRKRAEECIILERRTLRTLIDNLPDTIYVKDKNCRKIIANIADVMIIGCDKEADVLGKTDLELFPGPIGERGYANDKEVIGTGKSIIQREENFVNTQGNICWLSTSKIPLIDKNGEITGLVGIGRDITERKKSETELLKAKEKAEENDKLKTAFLHNISHEIRTPMNAIVGFSGLLNDPGLPPEKRGQFTDIIVRSANQLLSIITDIISISTIEAGQEKIQEKDCNINALCKQIYEQFSTKAKDQNITLRYKTALADDEAYIKTDEPKLLQVLSNITGNALKFTSQGHIDFGYAVKDNYLEFFIKDTGIGIPAEMFEEVFKRFHQIDSTITRPFGGSGLGLSISKAYVELLGGKMWINSELDKGSVFYFTIPYRKTTPVGLSPRQQDKEVEIKYEKPKIILIAEDEDLNFMLLEELLTDKNITIIRARNGFEAVEICKSGHQIDLVLMDLKMPIMNGYEATKQIRKILPDLPIIAQTAYTTDVDKNMAFASGCNDFISKPFKQELLVSKINEHLNKA